MKLFVVVLCYRVPELTIDCLRSLAGEVGRVPGARVAVCENGTGGDAPDRLGRAIAENGWDSWCELIVVHPNRGFCGGNNLVIRPALQSENPPEYVLLLNADTIVLEHALDTLVNFMDGNPRAGIAGSQFLSLEGTIQTSPFRFLGVLSELDQGLKFGPVSKLLGRWAVSPPATPTTNSPADWVSGACMILRTSMLTQIGLLDEGLYTYFDDIDICWRAREAGWETWYVPESKIIHLEGASTGVTGAARQTPRRRPAYWFQARRRFFLKNYGKLRTALVDTASLCGLALGRMRRLVQRKPDVDPPRFLADSFRHSVFRSGFAIEEVQNPLLSPGATAQEATTLSASCPSS